MIYRLDGKESSIETEGPMGKMPVKLKANLDSDGKLKLSSSSTFSTQMGEISITTKETWELADGGKTLKISRTMETPRGTNSSELVFTKKEVASVATAEIVSANESTIPMKPISGGVLNSYADPLVKPVYPEAAKAVRASGAVNVLVTIDEQGNVISAQAVSGHPLLRAASEEAAKKSKFKPTLLNGVAVKITGVIVYNFVAP